MIPSGPGDASFGSLTVGYGCGADPNLIGPELGFGFGMRDALPAGEKFLIVKTAWGGKSLAGDFRPPSSVKSFDPYCQGDCPNVVGHFYEVLVADVHAMLAPGAIAAMFPDLAGLTPKLTGVGWFQGWNDGCDMVSVRADIPPTSRPSPHSLTPSQSSGLAQLSPPQNMTAAYEQNMVNLVTDLRAEFGVPDLAVSIGGSGFNGYTDAEATRRASTWNEPCPTRPPACPLTPDKPHAATTPSAAAGRLGRHGPVQQDARKLRHGQPVPAPGHSPVAARRGQRDAPPRPRPHRCHGDAPVLARGAVLAQSRPGLPLVSRDRAEPSSHRAIHLTQQPTPFPQCRISPALAPYPARPQLAQRRDVLPHRPRDGHGNGAGDAGVSARRDREEID